MSENYFGGSPGFLFKRLISNSKPEELVKLHDKEVVSLINSMGILFNMLWQISPVVTMAFL